ncbi:MAG: metal-sensitive transcriptional regulator [Gemmatimonadaceae bacterium]
MADNKTRNPKRGRAIARKVPSTTGRRSTGGNNGPSVVVNDGLYLTGDAERAIYNRLSRLEGQVRGVKKMLAEHKSCDDMLVQVSALKQAVNGIAAELVQAHMETCVLGRVEAGEGRQALASLRSALAKVMKHG